MLESTPFGHSVQETGTALKRTVRPLTCIAAFASLKTASKKIGDSGGSTTNMAKKSGINRSPNFPEILAKLLDLVQHRDDDLSWEASLALKFYFERECITGDASWLSGVEAFLVFQDDLNHATGVQSIKELQISQEERDDLAHEVFRRIQNGVVNAWRHAFVLKQAVCVPGLQDDAAEYLRENWQKDEAVTLHLLYVIWASQRTSDFKATLTDISENAVSQELRDHATQNLRVLRELEDWQSQNPVE